MQSIKERKIGKAILCGFFVSLTYSGSAQSEYVLDWAADGTPTFSGTTSIHGQKTQFTGQTPFVYEKVDNYFHLILGNPTSGFAQEVYISLSNSTYQGFGTLGSRLSSSGGSLNNSADPLNNGAASGNPKVVEMRQLVTDGDFTSDFVKDKFLEKPSITQTIDSSDFQSQDIIDGSGIGYGNATSTSTYTSTVRIIDLDIPLESASFDYGTDALQKILTAGHYTWTPGSGRGGSSGTYTYTDDSFNVSNIKWEQFFDTTVTNPWVKNTNHP